MADKAEEPCDESDGNHGDNLLLQENKDSENHVTCPSLNKNESGLGEDMIDNHVDSDCKSPSDLNNIDSKDIAMDTKSDDPPQTPNNSKSDPSLSLGNLKKDDSGIDLEKSPASLSMKGFSVSECSDSISENFDDFTVPSSNNSVSEFLSQGEFGVDVAKSKQDSMDKQILKVTADESDVDKVKSSGTETSKNENNIENVKEVGSSGSKDSTDKVNTGDTDISSEENDIDKLKVVSTEDAMSTVSDSSVKVDKKEEDEEDAEPSGDSSDIAAFVKRTIRSSRKRRFQIPSSSSESDGEQQDEDGERTRRSGVLDSDDDMDEENGDDEKKKIDDDKKSSESEDDMDTDNLKSPKHKWRAIADIREREYGYHNSTPPGYFRQKVQGSLQMVQRFKLQYKMEYHEGCVNALHFNRIGTLLASGSDDLNVVLWNWIRNRPALVYDSGHRSNVFQAKFMPFSGDCHVVSCARDGQVRLADLSLTGVCKGTKKIAQHKGAAHKLALELDSPHIFLSCGEDAVTYEMDLRQEKPNKLVTTQENDKKVPMYSIHSNPSSSMEFCVGGRDHYIRLYDKRKIAEDVDGGVLKKFCPHHLVDSDIKANVTCACYNYNGTEVLGTYNDEDIYMFSNEHSDGAEYIHRYKGHRNNQTVKGVNFYGPQSEFIVSGSDCGHIFLWDKETEKIVQFMSGDEGGVINVLEPHPFAPILATSGLDHDVKIWSPLAEKPTDLKGLKKLMKQNKREREEERTNEPEMLDGQMLWFLMHHMRGARRRARRRAAQAASGREFNDDEDSSSSPESDTESEDSEGLPDRLQCAPS